MVNKGVWEKTSAANQAILKGCGALAEHAGIEASKAYTSFTLQGLRDGGMTVGKAGDALVGELKTIGETMTNEWLENSGEIGKGIVEKFKTP